MKLIHRTILSLILLIPTTTIAQIEGTELLSRCKIADTYVGRPIVELDKAFKAGYCSAWVSSIVTQMYTFGEEVPALKACLPKSRDNKDMDIVQGVRVLVRYMENNPDKLDLNAYQLTLMAIKDSFPCR